MTAYGETPAGFVVKPLPAILQDLQDAWLADVDPTADLSSNKPEGQILGIIANLASEHWELSQAAWNSYNREDVEGAGLDNIGDIQGTPREGPTYTQVPCNLTLAAGTYAPHTLVANVDGQQTLTFWNKALVTSSGGVVSGVLMEATTIGATPTINPNTLIDITSPVTGWTAITNPGSQTQLGANAELDTAYRVRQVEEIAGEGSSNQAATAAALIALGAEQTPAVTLTVNVLENRGDAPVIIGSLTLPPHSFAPIVYDPSATVTDAEIAGAIWANKPGGIPSYGTNSVVYTDPVLGDQVLQYTKPTGLPLYIIATVVLRPGFTIASVQDAIRTALVAASTAPTPPNGVAPLGQLLPGTPVVASQLEGVIMSVAGVFDCQLVTFDVTASPTNTSPIVISPTNIATVIAGNISVQQGAYP